MVAINGDLDSRIGEPLYAGRVAAWAICIELHVMHKSIIESGRAHNIL